MKSVTLFALFCLAVSANDNPVTKQETPIGINKTLIQMSPPIYTGQHDIVEISYPINNLQQHNGMFTLFFLEGDIQENGEVTSKILYILKDGKTKKLLENAQCIITEFGQNDNAFFGAIDGIYKFNPNKVEAEKYGTLTENVISIAKESKSDIFHIVNNKHQLYKITDGGTKKEKIDVVNDVKQVNIDRQGNIYILLVNKKVQVLRDNNLQDVSQLPESHNNIKMYQMLEIDSSVLITVDTNNYMITAFDPNAKGPKVELLPYKYDVELTALGTEATSLQFLGFEKKIYKLDLVLLTIKMYEKLVQKQIEEKIKIQSFEN